MLDRARQLEAELIRIRRTIHQQPELGFDVFKTASLVSETLTDLGVEHQTGVGKTGVVARLGNGNGPAIGIRADMDALPIHEANDVPYRSQIDGRMHACGHDVHTTALLGAAMLLHDIDFDGEIRLIFQPSEEDQDDEGKSGGMRMVEEGAVDGLDAIISLHVGGSVDAGKVALCEGFALANVDAIYGTIIGKGGHGAKPNLARDPIFMAAPILTALHGIVSRWVDPLQPAVVTVGRLQSGTVNNVIPGTVEMDITLRSTSDAVRAQLLEEVEQAFSIARALGGDYALKIVRGYPALYNDPEVTGWVRTVAQDLLGADNVLTAAPIMAAEDFSYMARASRGMMMSLGVRVPGGPDKFVHHPEFDVDESAIPVGAAIMAETALRFVRGEV